MLIEQPHRTVGRCSVWLPLSSVHDGIGADDDGSVRDDAARIELHDHDPRRSGRVSAVNAEIKKRVTGNPLTRMARAGPASLECAGMRR
jgi:hypothetical protein